MRGQRDFAGRAARLIAGVVFLAAAPAAFAADGPVRLSDKPSVQEIVNALNPPVSATRGTDPNAAAAAASAYVPLRFALNSAELTPEARAFLDALAAALNHADMLDVPLRIEGHTDATGSRGYNQILSERRAAAVRDYLVIDRHVDSKRLSTTGKGMTEPLPGISHYSAENRRVQFVNTGG